MAYLEKLSDAERRHLTGLECPVFDTSPYVNGPPLNKRRVAIISTAGLHRRDDRPFTLDPQDFYRVIPGDVAAGDLVMTHVSTNFDHTGFQRDWNTIFPIDRLKELSDSGAVGSVADFHYSFMGALDPALMEQSARDVAELLKKDKVDAALLVPV